MLDNLPQTLLRYRLWVGALAIVISIATWAVDLTELVYQCPYCRAQRTVIGLLGIILLLPGFRHWLSRYLASVFAVFGLGVAVRQHFGGWRSIMGGEFEWGEQWFVNPWMLSGFAIFIITALTLLIWMPKEQA